MLNAIRQGDVPRLKKNLTADVVNFVHPYTGDTPLHIAAQSVSAKRKHVSLRNLHNSFTPSQLSITTYHLQLLVTILK